MWSGALARAVRPLGGRWPLRPGIASQGQPWPPAAAGLLGGVRTVIRHPVKAHAMSLGHKLEVIYGPHTRRRHMPPKIPNHPLRDVDQNMNEVLTYNDLKIRWQWTYRFSKKKLKIARKWKPMRNIYPADRPTCSFIWHRQMPHRVRMDEAPPPEEWPQLDLSKSFAVFKSSVMHQHKVTVGDLVQVEKLKRREAGDKVVFGTVLLVGTRNFTIIGKPTVPYAKIKATVEQQTLSRECLVFRYRPRQKQSKFYRRRHWVTMLRIDEIVLTPEDDPTDPPPPKPVRLLDLWANRWLDPAEKEGIEMVDIGDGEVLPAAAQIYDGSEHQPGTYHRRGLTSCYRFWPDPQHTHWRW